MKKLTFLLIITCSLLLMLCNFYGCKKINPDVLTNATFGLLEITIDSNEIIITSFKGDNLKNLVIPETYQGKPITGIADNVFNYGFLLKNIIIRDGYTKDTANEYIKNTLLMETITLPIYIKNIGSVAFSIPSLREVKSLNPNPPHLGNGVFTTNQPLTIYVVDSQSLKAYQTQWTTKQIGTANVEWKIL